MKAIKKPISEQGYTCVGRNKHGVLYVGFIMDVHGQQGTAYQCYIKGASPAFLDKYFENL